MKYTITLTDRMVIPIDEDELPNVLQAVKEGSVVKVRQGIFNAKYFVSITEDQERKPINHFKDGLVERPNLPDIFSSTKRLN
jgi:hypothetical protein